MQRYLYNLATDKTNDIISGILKFFLLLLSFLYCLAVRLVLFFYRAKILKKFRPNCKIISIGNITLGGTGKTPLVEVIARYLIDRGIKLAILTRGYKREFSPEKKSDEASMLLENLGGVPVLVGHNRIENTKKAIKDYNVQVILLDDGFQHWRMHRDLDIVTIDSTNPFGNGKLIPRGILREPLSSLKRADIFILTKTDFGQDNLDKIKSLIKCIYPNSLIVETVHTPVSLYKIKDKQEIDLSQMADKNVCLLASIGDHRTFEKIIFKLGLEPAVKFYFLDHYQYRKEDLDKVKKSCIKNKINTIIITEKDIPRIKAINFDFPQNISILALKIGIRFKKNEELFFERLCSICNRKAA